MAAKLSGFVDRIIEIKYFRNNFNEYVIGRALVQLHNIITYYKSNTVRKALPVLLIVYESGTLNPISIPTYQERIIQLGKDFPDLTRLKIAFSSVDDIENFDVQTLLQK